jgi:hypothetical protein
MATSGDNEYSEKTAAVPSTPTEHSQTYSAEEAGAIRKPTGWKYKQLRIGNFKFPWYASPPIQLLIVSLVCFMCPGMFNALNGMGGGGQVDKSAGDKSNVALYSTFAVVGFFAGTFTNKLGIRTALSFGGIGYSVYIGSFLSFSHEHNYGFSIFAGALLGVCAGLLWCAQGAIMMSYPPEASKGRYISWFWMIFNLGAVIGSLVKSYSSFRYLSLLTLRHRYLSAKTSMLGQTAPFPMAPTSASLSSPSSAPCWLGHSSTQRTLCVMMAPGSLS